MKSFQLQQWDELCTGVFSLVLLLGDFKFCFGENFISLLTFFKIYFYLDRILSGGVFRTVIFVIEEGV